MSSSALGKHCILLYSKNNVILIQRKARVKYDILVCAEICLYSIKSLSWGKIKMVEITINALEADIDSQLCSFTNGIHLILKYVIKLNPTI